MANAYFYETFNAFVGLDPTSKTKIGITFFGRRHYRVFVPLNGKAVTGPIPFSPEHRIPVPH